MIKLENKPNVTPPDLTYPFGKSTDNTGTNNGFPLNTATLEDYHQFFAKLFADSGLVANNLPDNAVNGFQMMQAFNNNVVKKFVKEDTTILDGDVKTITRAEIEAAFGANNPFYPGATASTPLPFVDLQIQAWLLNGGTDWVLVENNGSNILDLECVIDGTTGDLTITVKGAPASPALPIRFVLIG